MHRLKLKKVESLIANFVQVVEALRGSLVELKSWHTTSVNMPLRGNDHEKYPEILRGYVNAECRKNLALIEMQRQKTR
jgi:hypothetical protein